MGSTGIGRRGLGVVMALASFVIPCSSCAGAPRQPTAARQSGENRVMVGDENTGLVRELGAPVVAIGSDGTALVQRGTHVEVLSPTLEEIQRLPIGEPSDRPGIWYAIAPGARHVAKVDRTGWITLWQVAERREVARLDPGPHLPDSWEMPLTGPAPQTASSWGAPTFLTDNLLATHHSRGVVLWDVGSGEVRCAFTDPALEIARETFLLGDDRAAVRGSSNTPGIHNAVLIEFSTEDCHVRRRHLVPPARDLIRAAGAGTNTFVMSLRGIRARHGAGVRQLRVANVPVMPQALHASSDGNSIAWAGADTTARQEIVVGVWLRQAHQTAIVSRLNQSDAIVHLRMDSQWLHAIDAGGKVWRWALPDAGEAEQVLDISEDQLAYEDAIVLMGLGDHNAALSTLDAIAASSVGRSTQFLRAYVQSLATRESPAGFRARVAEEGLTYANDSNTLATADVLASAEVLGPALDIYLYWLGGVSPGAGPERGADLGLELILQLSEASAFDSRAFLLRRLSQTYPDNARVRERVEDDEEFAEDDEDEEFAEDDE